MNATTTRKQTTTERIEALAEVLRAGVAGALAADPGPGQEHDGGSCNFDTPAFRVEGMRRAGIEQAAALAGISVTEIRWFGCRWYWAGVPLNGQAERRSRMSGAADRAMREQAERRPVDGLKLCEYQQAD